MSVEGTTVRASEIPEKNIVGKGANKAIKTLPQQEQNKFRAALMIAAGLSLLISGIKMLKNKNLNNGKPPGENSF